MKSRVFVAVLFSFLTAALWGAERILPIGLQGPGADYESNLPEGFNRLALGDSPPDFNLIGVDDKMHTLSEYTKGAKVFMVVFLSNHCPYSHAQEARMIPYVKKMMAKGLKVVSIQPNTPLPEQASGLAYSKYNDSFEEMKLYAKENNFPFDYLYDGDTQETTKAYGALATPHVFLFDENLKLRYSGRWDDGRFEEEESVTNRAAIEAMEAMFAGKPVAVPFTKPYGCATKWNTPDDKAFAGYKAQWKHEPITLDSGDAAIVAKLAKNGTKKLRLFTVWSTTSLTGISKLPEFSKLSQRLDRRDFEVITIALDPEKNREEALKLLNEHHLGMPTRIKESLVEEGRTSNNYLISRDNAAAVAKALDPQWKGAPLPHSVLIDRDGKVLWRYTGAGFDPIPLTRLILDKLGGMFETDGRYNQKQVTWVKEGQAAPAAKKQPAQKK
jgi:peroxiredoxin